tara:strand:+ start:75053 stop:75205 length:153 start_codon:yes stop_codon:yes gene_type:complete
MTVWLRLIFEYKQKAPLVLINAFYIYAKNFQTVEKKLKPSLNCREISGRK